MYNEHTLQKIISADDTPQKFAILILLLIVSFQIGNVAWFSNTRKC